MKKVQEISSYHDAMDEIELALQEYPDPGLTWRHFFSPGVYCREMTVPPGAVVTSEIHKTEHRFVLSAGMLTVRTEDGEKLIKAPYIGLTTPGTRRVAYFHLESVWTTVHYLDWVTGHEPEDESEFNKAITRAETELIENYKNPLLCHSQQQLD